LFVNISQFIGCEDHHSDLFQTPVTYCEMYARCIQTYSAIHECKSLYCTNFISLSLIMSSGSSSAVVFRHHTELLVKSSSIGCYWLYRVRCT